MILNYLVKQLKILWNKLTRNDHKYSDCVRSNNPHVYSWFYKAPVIFFVNKNKRSQEDEEIQLIYDFNNVSFDFYKWSKDHYVYKVSQLNETEDRY